MSNTSIIVNTRRIRATDSKVRGSSNEVTCVHTVRAEDLRVIRPIPGQAGLNMVLKLKG
jgi:hypothetical protein